MESVDGEVVIDATTPTTVIEPKKKVVKTIVEEKSS